MKLELTPASLAGVFSGSLDLIVARPILSLLGFLIITPILIVVVGTSVVFGSAIWRYTKLHILGTDLYSNFPRPPRTDRYPLLTGNFGYIRKKPSTEAHLEWARSLGTRLYVYRALFYTPRLFIGDPKAMLHMLSAANSYTYEKPFATRLVLKNTLGEGVLVAEGDVHKRQRKILQPAFSVGAIRELNPIFLKYARQLSDKIGVMVDRSAAATPGSSSGGDKAGADGINKPFLAQSKYALEASRPGAPILDMSAWTTRAALDIIGDAGFGYHFDSLTVDVDPAVTSDRPGYKMANALTTLFSSLMKIDLLRFVQLYLSSFESLRWVESIPSKRKRQTRAAYQVVEDVSMQIVEEKKKEIRGEMAADLSARGDARGKGNGYTKADFDEKEMSSDGIRGDGLNIAPGKDLHHVMMRANMAADVSPKEKLDDLELIGQITTLLVAGHETTSTQISWTLWLLAQRPDLQQKLRDEIHDHFGKDMERQDVGYDELMNMPYLDAVCKESFRFRSAVPSTIRIAKEASDVPLSRPYPTRDGKSTITSVHIPKGFEVFIPIQAINSDPEIWGPDAAEYKPERWLALPDSAKQNSLPMHLMTFISGPRGCIGNRFALAEFKAIMCLLVGNFHFEEVEGWTVEGKQMAVLRSRIKEQEEVGLQMPLRVSRISATSA